MKNSYLLLIFLVLNVCFLPESLKAQDLKVMTYNIRLDVASDGNNQWTHRKQKVSSQIQYYAPDIFGMQEALWHQLKFVAQELPEYDWIGVGRDDGKQQGEFSPIFYRKDQFEKLDEGTFWLAEDSSKPGKGWDAALPRIASWVQLRHKSSDTEFIVYNTHFDHVGKLARAESLKLIAGKVNEIDQSLPAIIMGDLNTSPEEASITGFKSGSKWQDAYEAAIVKHGPVGTFTGFNCQYEQRRIDYIFCNQYFEVLRYLSISEVYDGVFPSDHWPVLVEMSFRK